MRLLLLSALTGVIFVAKPAFAEYNPTTGQPAMGDSLTQKAKRSILGTSSSSSAATGIPVNLNPSISNLPATDFVDISNTNTWTVGNQTITFNQSDFNALKAAGVKTVVIQLSGGSANAKGYGWVNSYATSQIEMAQNAGLNIALYHFAYFPPLTSTSPSAVADATTEANFFLNTLATVQANLQKDSHSPLPSSTVMIADCEATGGAAVSSWTTGAQTFATVLNNNGFSNVKYYTQQSWANSSVMNPSVLGAKNLWVAQYPADTPALNSTGTYSWPTEYTNNSQFGAWQYTSQMYFNSTTNLQNNNLDTSVDFGNFFNIPIVTSTPVYRLYNPNNLEHFYTSSLNEKNTLVNIGWGKYEGISYYAPVSGGIPVYRLYHPGIKMHLYTTDTNEKNVLSKSGWNYEGIVFYAATSSTGDTPVYRLYNSGIKQHLFTTDLNEKNVLSKSGWNYEGISWYGLKS
ncbi:GH25 family lysozyme [Lactococcus fujiensis]|nr:GH25 family lysozyme [Lactococcus fujiensis]